MNRDQIRYLKTRVEKIVEQKHKLVQDMRKPVPDTLDEREKLLLIKSGQVKMKDLSTITYPYVKLVDAYMFPEDAAVQAAVDWNKRWVEENKKCIQEQSAKVLDNLILGDISIAVSMLEQFENLTFSIPSEPKSAVK